MTVHITDMIFPVSVTVTVPKYPNVIKLTTNKTIAILLNIPLYRIDATLLHLTKEQQIVLLAAAITISLLMIWNSSKHCVIWGVIPYRGNMFWCNQWVCLFKIR